MDFIGRSQSDMRRISAIAFAIIICLIATSNAPAQGPNLTLDEAWRLTLENDPNLKASEEILNESEGDRTSGLSVFLPQLSGDLSIRHYFKEEGFVWDSGSFGWGVLPFPATEDTVPKYSGGIDQLIFDSGKSIASYKSLSSIVEASGHNVFAYRQQRAVELVMTYSNYYLSKKRLEVAQHAADALAEHARTARLKYEQNLVPKTDMLSAQVSAEKAGLGVIEASDDVDIARQRLAALTGEESDDIVVPSVPPPPENLQPPSERPEIKAKTAEMKAARYEANKEGLSYLPEIRARAEAAYIDDDYRINKDQYTVMGSISVPIFDGRYHWGQRNKAMAMATRKRFERESLEKAFEVEQDDAKRAWRRSDKEIEISSLNRRKADENLRDARLGYSENMVSALEVRDAVRLWSEATLDYHKAICNRQVAAARLRQAGGASVLDHE